MKTKRVIAVSVLAGALLGAPAILFAQGTPGAKPHRPGQSTVPAVKEGPLTADDVSSIARRWGIQVESMRLASGGYMIEFRYRIVDANKAQPIFARGSKPRLKDDASGLLTTVPNPPTTGALRSTNDAKAGRTYFMFFANPARFIKVGNTVTVTIGEFSVSGIPVTDDSAPAASAPDAPPGDTKVTSGGEEWRLKG